MQSTVCVYKVVRTPSRVQIPRRVFMLHCAKRVENACFLALHRLYVLCLGIASRASYEREEESCVMVTI